ncbi:hypothetical protein P154DRAFT_540891 [Amniculicola lignicola CBS 123094]|uniref:Uncharacterized protein n=1 Tax=Amniculicola lignicola CBS 123094 TaxID=1392246 RepID=A0A6A5VW03_9PLEO|nr:hypothetical protein P154DRAFT_540891 [Amniculicola lignicola CBS 123094]
MQYRYHTSGGLRSKDLLFLRAIHSDFPNMSALVETLHPIKANYPLIRSWRYDSARKADTISTHPTANVPICLIDVQSRDMNESTLDPPVFAALSYVWGKAGHQSQPLHIINGRERLPERCVQAAEDAITVTRNIGIGPTISGRSPIYLTLSSQHETVNSMGHLPRALLGLVGRMLFDKWAFQAGLELGSKAISAGIATILQTDGKVVQKGLCDIKFKSLQITRDVIEIDLQGLEEGFRLINTPDMTDQGDRMDLGTWFTYYQDQRHLVPGLTPRMACRPYAIRLEDRHLPFVK